ncbi:MAG TPA: hypothetical protein VEJ20_01690 [Candidatus Eremiobacteraceae bacterium]|nr:hypothetical protein [Candidatus Eremiobacteraceae bacterium]
MTQHTTSARKARGIAIVALVAICAIVATATRASASSGGSDRVEFGSDVTVQAGQEITGDLVVFGGDAKVYGHVDGDAVVMGGDLYIAPGGEVDGSTVAFGGTVDNESTVKPRPHHGEAPPMPVMPTIAPIPVVPIPIEPEHVAELHPHLGWYWYLIVSAFLSLIAFALVPGGVNAVRDDFVRKPVAGTVIGLIWPFAFIAIIVALAITVIGIVLMPVAVFGVGVAYLLGRAAIALLLGRRLFEIANVVAPSPLAAILVGLLIITGLEALLPLALGIVLEVFVGSISIGAAVLPLLHLKPQTITVGAFGYNPPPTPIYTPPTAPPPPGPPAVPQ